MGDPSIDTWNLIAGCVQNSFNSRYKYTIGCDIGTLDVQLPYELVTISIWDISSSERFRFFRSSFFRGASCAILAFDLTRYHSFNPTLTNLITEIYTILGGIPIILIGCNAGDADQRQVTRDEIEELCERMARVVYLEIDSYNERINSAFETIAELIVSRMGLTEEDRRLAYEWKKQRLETLTTTLEQLNFFVNERDEVEIINQYGLFSINILNSSVTFEPIVCVTCDNYNCYYKKQPRRKSLCIVSASEGWSNLELENRELLILAKILAIAEANLPSHVLNQMQQVEVCSEIITETEENPIVDFENLPEPEIMGAPEIEPTIIGNLFQQILPVEAKTLLRNYQIQFFEGRLPYAVYNYLKERLKNILNSSP